MSRRPRAMWALVIAVALASVPLLAGSAQAATCGTSDGVSVVVQFPDGHIESGCAPGDPDSGLAALQGAGFAYSFDSRNPGFVCTIKGAPASRDCMKPDYWAYYHDTGHGWAYSNEGAATFDPPAGSSEGWRFGTGSAPGAEAPVRSSPEPAPSPTPTSSGSGSTGDARGGSTRGSTSGGPSASATSPTVSASPTASAKPRAGRSARASHSAPAAAAPSASDPTGPTGAAAGAQTQAVSNETDDSGSLSWVWGVGLLVLVAVTAGVVSVVRRRSA